MKYKIRCSTCLSDMEIIGPAIYCPACERLNKVPVSHLIRLYRLLVRQSFPFLMLGVTFAVVLSYTTNHHIIWAICHGILAWFYVAYRALGWMFN